MSKVSYLWSGKSQGMPQQILKHKGEKKTFSSLHYLYAEKKEKMIINSGTFF